MPDRAINTVKKLGRYDIVRVLGKGAMGVVYEARDPNLNRKVAIKTVRVDSLAKEEAAEYELRFRTEAHSAARLQHPNIVSVYDSDRDGSTPFLVMEFVKGEDLKHYLDSGQRYSLEQSVRMMRDLLAALDYAHQRKIVHRDIKPANLLIEADGRVKLTDFGVARIQDSGEATRTQGGMVGTLKYMSPEQVEGKTVDALSDLFSAGIVLYQLLTDRRPFDGDSYFSIVNQITNQHPPAPSSVNRLLPTAVDAVVSRALAKDKTQRFANAQDFSLALQAAARRADPTITPSANPYKIIEQHGTGSMERSGSTASSTLTGTSSTVTQELELVYWKDVKDSDDIEDLEGFLKRFPEGVYSDLAKRRLKRMAQERAEQGQDRYDQTFVAPKQPAAETESPADHTLGVSWMSESIFTADTDQPTDAAKSSDTTQPLATLLATPQATPQAAQQPVGLDNDSTVINPSPVAAKEVAPSPVAAKAITPSIKSAVTAQVASPVVTLASHAAPKGKSSKKTGVLVGLVALVLGATALWAWQRPGNSIITESSLEAGLPAVAASATSASASPSTATMAPAAAGPDSITLTAAANIGSAASVTASLPVSTTSVAQINSTSLAVIAPKPAASSARAIAAAKLQAQREAQARANANASSNANANANANVNTPAAAPQHNTNHSASTTHQAASSSAAPASQARPGASRARDSAATGPQEACEGKLLFGYGACLYDQCAKPVFFNHPYCVDQRERQEKTRNRN
jgi:eukaryotic-like serine/threonine-protein kinase